MKRIYVLVVCLLMASSFAAGFWVDRLSHIMDISLTTNCSNTGSPVPSIKI